MRYKTWAKTSYEVSILIHVLTCRQAMRESWRVILDEYVMSETPKIRHLLWALLLLSGTLKYAVRLPFLTFIERQCQVSVRGLFKSRHIETSPQFGRIAQLFEGFTIVRLWCYMVTCVRRKAFGISFKIGKMENMTLFFNPGVTTR